jgi:hypothetical protein
MPRTQSADRRTERRDVLLERTHAGEQCDHGISVDPAASGVRSQAVRVAGELLPGASDRRAGAATRLVRTSEEISRPFDVAHESVSHRCPLDEAHRRIDEIDEPARSHPPLDGSHASPT